MGDLVGVKIPESEFLEGFRDHLEAAKAAFSTKREKEALFFRTYGGDPWPSGVKEAMEEEDRPVVTHNLCLTIVDTILGQQMQERREIQFKGVGTEDIKDQKSAEWMTFLTRTWWQQANGYRHEMQALMDQLITGYGWGHVYLDMSRFPFRPALEHVETWEMWPDPKAKDDNLTDARWLIRERPWLYEDVEAMWPEKAKEIQPKFNSGTSRISPVKVVSNYEGDGMIAPDDDTVMVWEYQFKKKEKWVAFIEPTTQQRDSMPESDFKKIQKDLTAQGLQVPAAQPFLRDVFYRTILAGSEKTDTVVLQKPEKIPADRFTYVCLTGFRRKLADSGRTEFFGMMDLLYEPQIWAAKIHSNIVEIMARSNKNLITFESGAIVDPRKAREDMARPGALIELADGAIRDNRIQFHQSAPYPHGYGELLSYSIQSLYRTGGVTEILMGTSRQERSNVLVSNYQDRSLVLLSPLTDPLEGFRIGIGRVLAAFIQRYVPPEDLDRMIEDEGIEGLTIQTQMNPQTGQEEPMQIAKPSDYLRAADLTDFDVVIDTGSATTTEKQQIWSVLSEQGVMKFMADSGVPMDLFFPKLLKLLPIRAEVAKEIGDTMQSEMDQQRAMQTAQGIVEAYQSLPPEEMMKVQQAVDQIAQQVQQQMQQQQQEAQGGQQQQPPQQQQGGPVQ